jgi:hypothetical protein
LDFSTWRFSNKLAQAPFLFFMEQIMPRKPLPYNLHPGPWALGPSLPLDERPALVATIGSIMVTWPAVLHQMGVILGVLIGGDSEAGVALFSTLQNARARREILNVIAELRLRDRRLELFHGVFNVARSAEIERNHLAHGCFGVSAELPESVLWIETKHFGPWNVAEVRKDAQTTSQDYIELAKNIFVYDHRDLKAILEQVTDTFTILLKYSDYLRYPPPIGSPTDEARYLQLCNLPRVATALHQIRSGKQNSQ